MQMPIASVPEVDPGLSLAHAENWAGIVRSCERELLHGLAGLRHSVLVSVDAAQQIAGPGSALADFQRRELDGSSERICIPKAVEVAGQSPVVFVRVTPTQGTGDRIARAVVVAAPAQRHGTMQTKIERDVR